LSKVRGSNSGGRIDGNGGLVTDKIGIVYSYVPLITEEVKRTIKGLAVEVRELLHEDAITIVIDNEAEFY